MEVERAAIAAITKAVESNDADALGIALAGAPWGLAASPAAAPDYLVSLKKLTDAGELVCIHSISF